MLALLAFVLAAVTVIVAAQFVANRTGLPAAALLTLAGLLYALLPGQNVILEPSVVLTFVIPPLIYSAALNSSLTAIRKNLRTVISLSIGLVLATAVLTGVGLGLLVPGVGLAAGVALAAVALSAVLTAVFSAADVSSLANRQRNELSSAIAVAAASSWEQNQGWASADLAPVLDFAARSGLQLQVRDAAGHAVHATRGFASATGPKTEAPVLVKGRQVGSVLVGLTSSGLGAADAILRTALLRAIAGTAGLAALLALVAGLGLSRRITRPVARLISVTRAMASGDRSARAGEIKAPGELRELAAAFDHMADTLDYEDKIRRDMVASVAHELRTPVAVLQAGHEALLDGVIEPSPDELGSLRDEVLRLGRMVDDLQTMAAADAAVLQLTREQRDLADIAESAANSLARRFETAEVTLDRQLAPALVVADQRWMHQVVTNLLGNALKFTPAGGTVTIRTSHDGANAVLEVADTGIGIPPDELPHIFDRFWRGQAAAQTSGSGIGLAIAAELAVAHGGTLTAASQPGQGTQLTLTLPLSTPPGV